MDLSDLPHQGLCSLCFQESEHFISIQTVVSLNDVEIGKELTTVDRNENNVIVFQEMLKDTGFFSGIFSLKTGDLPPFVCQYCFRTVKDAYCFQKRCILLQRENIKGRSSSNELPSSANNIKSFKYSTPKDCPHCMRINESYNDRWNTRQFDNKNHSEFGYIACNQCPFCSKRMKNAKDFCRHLNTVHKIPLKTNAKQSHCFVDKSLFIYELMEKADLQISTSTGETGILYHLNESERGEDKEELGEDSPNLCKNPLELEPPIDLELKQIEMKKTKNQSEKMSSTRPSSGDPQKNSTSKKMVNKNKTSSASWECQKLLSSHFYLQRHLNKHQRKRFLCKECKESFLSREELNAHTKELGHDKPLLCPECGLRCRTSTILMIHNRRHTGEKPFQCSYCDRAFPRSHDLRVHERYHTNEKSHFCETCGKGFQRKYNLNIHMRVHTGEKPYKCPQCPQAFAQSNDLKAHIRRHTGERFRCELCEATFLLGHQIRQHKLQEHGIKDIPPTQRLKKFSISQRPVEGEKVNVEQSNLQDKGSKLSPQDGSVET